MLEKNTSNKPCAIGAGMVAATLKPKNKTPIEVIWKRAKRHSKQVEYRAANLGLLHEEYCYRRAFKFFVQAAELTEETGIKYEVDHIIPMALGGWHHHLNLHVLPQGVNASKSADPFWEMDGYKCWKHVPRHLWPKKLKPSYSVLNGTHMVVRRKKLDNKDDLAQGIVRAQSAINCNEHNLVMA